MYIHYIHTGPIEKLSALFSNRPSVELLETNSIPDGVSLHSRGVEASTCTRKEVQICRRKPNERRHSRIAPDYYCSVGSPLEPDELVT